MKRKKPAVVPREAQPVSAYECVRCSVLFVSPEPEPFCFNCRATLAARGSLAPGPAKEDK